MDKILNDVKFTMDIDPSENHLEKSYDFHNSSNFNTTKVYLSEIEQRNLKKRREQSSKNRKNIVSFKSKFNVEENKKKRFKIKAKEGKIERN